MKRRGLLVGGTVPIIVGVAGCASDLGGESIPEPDEAPSEIDGDSLDFDEIESSLMDEISSDQVRIEVMLTATDSGLVRSETVEETIHRVTLDGETETGTYLTAKELGGSIGSDPYSAEDVEKHYYGDGITYQRGDIGDDPSLNVSETSFDGFIEELATEAAPLRDNAENIAFNDPDWTGSDGVYVAEGTEMDEETVGENWEFDNSEIHIDEEGLFVYGEAELTGDQDIDIEMQIDVTAGDDIEVQKPDWVPNDFHEQTIGIAVERSTAKFIYEQGFTSENRLVIPANSFIEFDLTGDYTHHESLGVADLRMKINLTPGEEDTIELFFSEDDIGTYQGESFELAEDDVTFEMVVMENDEFENWIDNNK